MSLLDNPPHAVIVQQYGKVAGRYGEEWGPVGDPIEHRCAVQPMEASEAESLDMGAETTSRVIARSWPWGPHTRVTHEGREWEQVGEARRYRMGRRTEHDDVVLRAVGAHG